MKNEKVKRFLYLSMYAGLSREANINGKFNQCLNEISWRLFSIFLKLAWNMKWKSWEWRRIMMSRSDVWNHRIWSNWRKKKQSGEDEMIRNKRKHTHTYAIIRNCCTFEWCIFKAENELKNTLMVNECIRVRYATLIDQSEQSTIMSRIELCLKRHNWQINIT